MSVKVILRSKQLLNLIRVRVELQPLLVGRLGDAMRVDAGRLNPTAYVVHAVLRRSKQVVDFVRRKVLAIPMGSRVRTN